MSAAAPEVYDHVAEGAFDDVVRCAAHPKRQATHMAHHELCANALCGMCAGATRVLMRTFSHFGCHACGAEQRPIDELHVDPI